MSEVLVSALLARLDEIEKRETNDLIDQFVSWTIDPSRPAAEADVTVRCLGCDWCVVGREQVVDPQAVDHVTACMPTLVLRLCRAHRDMVEQYEAAAKLTAERNRKRVHGALVMEAEAAEQALLDVVATLARGLGVEETTDE